jgi:hypothetical protein
MNASAVGIAKQHYMSGEIVKATYEDIKKTL